MKHKLASPLEPWLDSRSSSRGQVLILFAASLVTLLLIGAIVIDVGFVFMTRRHEQNAADPAALAAARYAQPQPPSATQIAKMWTAACFYALQNGFQARRTDNNAACDAGGATDGSFITVRHPPSIAAGEFAGLPGYVEVAISTTYKSFLARVAGISQIAITASAVAAFDSPGSAGSSSLVALSPHACPGGRLHGGGSGGGVMISPAAGVTSPGGYVQINSDCGAGLGSEATDDACSNVSSGAAELVGGITLVAPAMFIRGACDRNSSPSCNPGPPPSGLCMDLGGTNPDPDLDEGASYVGDPLALIRAPVPVDLVIQQCGTGAPSTALSPKQCSLKDTVVLDPGTYYGGWKISTSGAFVTLNPGIYIIAGGGIDDSNGLLTSAAGHVMIFSTDASPAYRQACIAGIVGPNDVGCQRDLKMNGSGSLDLIGLDFGVTCAPYGGANGCPYSGMLAWQDGRGSAAARIAAGDNTDDCDISLGGGTSLHLEGTVYAKCGLVTVDGNSSTDGCTVGSTAANCASIQIISDRWDVGGSGVLDMPYDPSAFYHLNLKGLVR